MKLGLIIWSLCSTNMFRRVEKRGGFDDRFPTAETIQGGDNMTKIVLNHEKQRFMLELENPSLSLLHKSNLLKDDELRIFSIRAGGLFSGWDFDF